MQGVRLSIDTKDLNNFIRDIDKYTKNKIAAVDKEIARTTYAVQMKAKSKAPTKFSLLKSTIDVEIVKGQLSGKVIARAHYAPYREFGTGNLVKVPAGYANYAMQFKGRGIRQVNSKATPYLIPSITEEQPRFEGNIKNILSKP
jgi:hypothetical protein